MVNNEVILDVGQQRSNEHPDPGWALCCHGVPGELQQLTRTQL
jgi:hypothetical protein